MVTEKVFEVRRKAVFRKEKKKRYELNIECMNEGKKEKAILVIGLFPSSDDVVETDTTTNYILNNLLPMKFTTITICNLFATIGKKLTKDNSIDDADNLAYLQEVLQREFHTVLVGYGNSMAGNKAVEQNKKELDKMLKDYRGNVMELVDKNEIYSRLHTIHPLFAGQRFSGQWKFRKHIVVDTKEEKGDK